MGRRSSGPMASSPYASVRNQVGDVSGDLLVEHVQEVRHAHGAARRREFAVHAREVPMHDLGRRRAGGRVRNAVLTDDVTRHALPNRRLDCRIGQQREIRVHVSIDEPWRQPTIFRVENRGRLGGFDLSDGCNVPVPNANGSAVPRTPHTVHDAGMRDQNVESSPALGSPHVNTVRQRPTRRPRRPPLPRAPRTANGDSPSYTSASTRSPCGPLTGVFAHSATRRGPGALP